METEYSVEEMQELLGFGTPDILQIMEAEKQLEQLKMSFYGETTDLEKLEVLDQASEVLKELIRRIDSRIVRLSRMRESFAARLERTIQLKRR